MKFLVYSIFLVFLVLMLPLSFAQSTPDWIKNTAGWWATDMISENEFVNAIQFLVNEEIIQVNNKPITENSQNIPDWIKNTAGWWATDMISENEFVNAIQFLVNVGIIDVSEKCKFHQNDFLHLTTNAQEILCKNIDITFIDDFITSENTDNIITINKHGFRGSDFNKLKSDNTYRIFVIGSSLIYGEKTLDENTIPSQLQKLFDSQDLDLNIQVINAGMGSAWSKTEVQSIKENLINYEPDLLIVYDGWTDVTRQLVKNGYWSEDANIDNWITRWTEICKLGEKNNFETIITIQPILGSSNKFLTNQESMLYQHHPTQTSHVNLLKEYSSNLVKLEPFCSKTADLTNVYDEFFFPIFIDRGHVTSLGGKIIANEFFKLSVPLIFHNDQNIQNKLLNNVDLKQPHFASAKKINSSNNFSGNNIEEKKFKSITNSRFWFSILKNTSFSETTLSDVDFRFAKLFNPNFQNSVLENVTFSRGYLENSNFSNTRLSNVGFSTTSIQYANFENSILENIENFGGTFVSNNFNNSEIKNTIFKRVFMFDNDFSTTKFTNIKMESVVLASSDFSGVDFSSIKMESGVDFSSKQFNDGNIIKGAILNGADFSKSDMQGTIFSNFSIEDDQSEIKISEYNHILNTYGIDASNANFSNLNLSGKNLSFVKLNGADLSNTDLSNTDLQFTNLQGANLQGANLQGANLQGANLQCINHVICESNKIEN